MAHLDCGHIANHWVWHALSCLPDKIRAELDEKLAFVCMAESDARRLTPQFVGGRHVIVLSERIVPLEQSDEGSPEVRYLYFGVLHEVAHAFRQHRLPSEISQEENEHQEAEADELAFEWFNGSLQAKANPMLPPFTRKELAKAKATAMTRAVPPRPQAI